MSRDVFKNFSALEMEALRKALAAPSLPIQGPVGVQGSTGAVWGRAEPSPPPKPEIEASALARQRAEERAAEQMARNFVKGVTKLHPEAGDLLVLHIPDQLTQVQFNRISKVMEILVQKLCPEVSFIVLPEVVTFGRTIKTKMLRKDVEEQLRALLGVLMSEDAKEG